jgi:hypothetical protein
MRQARDTNIQVSKTSEAGKCPRLTSDFTAFLLISVASLSSSACSSFKIKFLGRVSFTAILCSYQLRHHISPIRKISLII